MAGRSVGEEVSAVSWGRGPVLMMTFSCAHRGADPATLSNLGSRYRRPVAACTGVTCQPYQFASKSLAMKSRSPAS
jgi:hypothetical protein